MTEPIEPWVFAPERVGQFDAQAAAYDRYRPRYPGAVFELIAGLDGIRPASGVLEIGAGTGIATLPLVERGLRVTAVEPAPAMAEIAQAKLGAGAEVIVSRIEDWARDGQFDAVVAFNSWHWLDPAIAISLLARTLRPGGWLALVWTEVVSWGQDPFEKRLAERTGGAWPKLPVEAVFAPSFEPIRGDGRFTGFDVHRLRFERTMDAATYLAVTRTYGAGLSVADLGVVEGIINDDLGGSVTKTEEAVAYVTRYS